jgi:hypothetical protein
VGPSKDTDTTDSLSPLDFGKKENNCCFPVIQTAGRKTGAAMCQRESMKVEREICHLGNKRGHMQFPHLADFFVVVLVSFIRYVLTAFYENIHDYFCLKSSLN